MNLVGETLIGKYGGEGKVISCNKDIFKVSLDNGLVKDFTYEKLIELFKVDEENKYIGRKFISTNGYVCKIIKQVTFDKLPSHCHYLVEFEDGTQKELSYITLSSGCFKKKNDYIGKRFTGVNNCECEIIKQVTFDKLPSHCHYLVEFEDGTQKELSYDALRLGYFSKPKSYINAVFKSLDDCYCKIIKQVTFDKEPWQCRYLVEFEDGYKREFNCATLRKGKFKKYKIDKDYFKREYICSEGYKCTILKQVTFDKSPSYCKYLARFDNGYEKEVCMSRLISGKFSCKPREFRISRKNIIDNKYYKCTCKLCNYNDFLTIDEMVEHLQTKHNLYNKG